MLPSNVTGELDLTQSLTGGLDNGTAATRGYTTSAPGMPYFSNASQVSWTSCQAMARMRTTDNACGNVRVARSSHC